MTQPTKTPKLTLERTANRIEFRADSGAVVAYLTDGEDQIQFDPLADTREALGLVNFRQVIAAAGLDVDTVRAIDSMPGPSIGPESVL